MTERDFDAYLENHLRREAEKRYPFTAGQRARLCARLEGRKPVKRMTGALACVLTLVFTLTAMGLAIPSGPREAASAPPVAQVMALSFVIPEEGDFPAAVLTVQDVRYDGQNLMIGYRMEGGRALEQTPMDKETGERIRTLGLSDYIFWHELPAKRYFAEYLSKIMRQKEALWTCREWALDNRLLISGQQVTARRSYVTYTDDGLTCLCFEGLDSAFAQGDTLQVTLPLLKVTAAAAWVDRDHYFYHGAVGETGDTRMIALSIPRGNEKVALPEGTVVAQSPVDVVMEDDTHFVVRAMDGYPETRITVDEARIEGSRLLLSYTVDGQAVLDADIPAWQQGYMQRADELLTNEDWAFYWQKELKLLEELAPGEQWSIRYLTLQGGVEDAYGIPLIHDAFGIEGVYLGGSNGQQHWRYTPAGTYTDGGVNAPLWYGRDACTLYLPVQRIARAVVHREDGIKFVDNASDYTWYNCRIPVTAVRGESENVLWDSVLMRPALGMVEEEDGVFRVGNEEDAPCLTVLDAAFDGKSVTLSFCLDDNELWRVSQELENERLELLGPWTDLYARYDTDATHFRYDLRLAKDDQDAATARTSDAGIPLDADQVTVTLVMEKVLPDGTVTTNNTPRLRITLPNTGTR